MKLFGKLRGYIVLLLILLLVFWTMNSVFVWFGGKLTLTAEATVYYEPEIDEYDYLPPAEYCWERVPAAKQATVYRDQSEKSARFENGTAKLFMDYGPTEIVGCFHRTGITQVTDAIPLEDDWPFVLYLFNTRSGRSFRAYIDLEVHPGSTEASAVLYVFYEGSARPKLSTWKGGIGEKIVFDNIEI